MNTDESKQENPPPAGFPQGGFCKLQQLPPRIPLRPPLRTPGQQPNPEAPPHRKRRASRKPGSTPIKAKTREPWHRTVTRSGRAARKRWGPIDLKTAERMARAYRAAILPRNRPGSKPDKETLKAAEMYRAGMESYFANPNRPPMRQYQRDLWQSIYREVLPDYPRLDKPERQYQTGKLGRNVRKWLQRRGVKFPLPIRTRAKTKSRIV